MSEAPDAIPRLRRFILDLAVRGKLVEQDPKDEPASELLVRIQAEKAHLLTAKEIKKEKALPDLDASDISFEQPKGWEWVRMRQVTSDRGQKTPDQDFTYIDVTAINKEVGRVEEAQIVRAADAPSRARKVVKTGDVIYSCVRPYLLNVAVISEEIHPMPIASTAFAVLNGFGLVEAKYLWIVLRSPFMVENVEARMRGQAYPAINDSDFALLPFPLPPLAEQHRIVAKVDELMALCDQLEESRAGRERTRDQLVAASLQRLNQPDEDEGAFREDARFTFTYLPRLTTRPAHIKQLRQTILNLAVRGKLVEQDPNDEPASELLKRIQEKKERLVIDGKSRKEKGLPNIKEEEKAFNLPGGWCWARLGSVIEFVNGYAFSSSDFCEIGIGVVKIGDISDGEIHSSSMSRVPASVVADLDSNLKVRPGDMLIAMSGATTGKIGFNKLNETFYLNQRVGKISPILVSEQFLCVDLNTKVVENLRKSAGSAIPNLSTEQIKKIVLALPPLAEQQRIVAKVDELMALCDQLETHLANTESESLRLLEAVLQEALAQPT
jgi:type I restriction enzyme S subunit